MGLLEEVLKYSKTHGAAVIVVLVGVIVVGSVGGGLWIQNLNSALEQKDSLANQRATLVEERYRNRYSELNSRYRTLVQQATTLRESVQTHQAQVLSASQELTDLATVSKLDRAARDRLLKQSELLKVSAEKLLRNTETDTKDVEGAGRDMQFADAFDHPPAGAEPLRAPNIWIIVALLVVSLVAWLVFRRRHP